MARFTFIGKFEANTDVASKGYYLREGKTSKGNPYVSINFQVVQEKNNRSFVELFGAVSDSIMTMDNDLKKIEVKWDDRLDDDTVKDVASFKKTIVKLGDDKFEFVSPYDAINYIDSKINDIKGKTVIVTGQRKKNIYKGKISDRFEMSTFRVLSDEEEEEVNKKLTVNMDFVFDKNSFDTADWKKEHKLVINGWTEEYISDIKENRYVDQQVVFDCSKINFDNEEHIKKVNFRLKMMDCELDDNNNIVVKAKAKKFYQIGMVTTFVNGQEKVEFDESMLTETQKEALELGIKTLEDFRPAGQIFGARVVVYKLKDFDLRKDSKYEDGCITLDITQDDFDEKYYVPVEAVTESDIIEKETKKSSEDDEDDLFG